MKLLKKSVVGMEIENQRKQQIDEGLTLARKIDVLRETFASLQSQHTVFVNGMRQDLENQTKELFDRVANLKLEIEHLENYKKGLAVPEIEAVKERLKEKEKKLKESIFMVNTRERELVKIINKQ